MPARKASRRTTGTVPAFDAQTFLDSSQEGKSIAEYRRGETIFMEGEACDDVLYVRMGGVTLSVRSKTGREAVAATLGPGDFFGEGCLAGESSRTRNATAITPSTILSVGKVKMARLLRTQPAMADRFIAHLLGRYARIEESLIDQLFDSSEPHVNVFLNEFRRLGFVEYKSRGPLRINSSLLGVILRD